ncbi:hypothetical protein GP486_003601 [Trichoglossum hirsutum]|uniref:Phospholipid-binding protein n=1 Tax=Trichoglossum hirsutum TaxID=265104 RepID=A0A9P8LCU1_9PEZI|nr:hypothetical protein GP486_003601 [Trichoglossum hirsutum]
MASSSSTNPEPTNFLAGELPPVPPSPTHSCASTANPISALNLPLPPPPPSQALAVLTKADLQKSQEAYTDLLSTAKAYRLALAALSSAASAFGTALESCARLKEARSPPLLSPSLISNSYTTAGPCTADSLMTASGVHHLVANHQLILSETVYRSFEVPLLHELDGWKRKIEEEDVGYQQEVKARTREIRRMEKEGSKLQKERKRDIGRFRGHLVRLTLMLDGLTTLHSTHSRNLLFSSQEASSKILDSSSLLVRAEVEIYENLARKGWSGGGLDELLERSGDPFSSEAETNGTGEVNGSRKFFSILPTKSILPVSPVDQSTAVERGRRGSAGAFTSGDRYQSLTGALSDYAGEDDERSIFSGRGLDDSINSPRGLRPFSPSPSYRLGGKETEDIRGGDGAGVVKAPGPSEEQGYGEEEEGEEMLQRRGRSGGEEVLSGPPDPPQEEVGGSGWNATGDLLAGHVTG